MQLHSLNMHRIYLYYSVAAGISSIVIGVPVESPPSAYKTLSRLDTRSDTGITLNALYKRGNCCGTLSKVDNVDGISSDPRGASRPKVPYADNIPFPEDETPFANGPPDENSNNDAPTGGPRISDVDDDYTIRLRPDPAEATSQEGFAPTLYLSEAKEMYPLNDILHKSDSKGLEAIWNLAEKKGDATRALLDKYAGNKRSRLADPRAGPPPQAVRDLYEVELEYYSTLAQSLTNTKDIFDAVGIPYAGAENPDGLWMGTVQSTAGDKRKAFQRRLQVTMNVEFGLINVYARYSPYDANSPGEKLYTSEIMWQLWKEAATKDAERRKVDPNAAIRGLKYIMQSQVYKHETVNIMTMAHLSASQVSNSDGSKAVDNVPKDAKKSSELLREDAGQGRWLHDNPAFNRLIGTPNVKPTIQLLIDHSIEMDNIYPSVVHTFPERSEIHENIKPEDRRMAYIVVELGPEVNLSGSTSVNSLTSLVETS